MSLFPIFVKLQGRPVVVVGGGNIAAGKIPGVLQAQARVRVIAPQINSQIAAWIDAGEIQWSAKEFAPEDLQDATLVIAATSIPSVNAAVFQAAETRGIFCNAVDDIANCHFYYGSIVQRGDLQIAISTNGKSPALAQRLRKELEQQYPVEYAAWLDSLGDAREKLRASSDPKENLEENKAILHRLASPEMFSRFVHSQARESAPTKSGHRAPGTVYLVGAGPGDPELLTVKAARLLAAADMVLHDSLVSAEILAMISPRAEIIDVGKRAGRKLLTQDEINSLLVSYAESRTTVVRLKGGDPSMFGRAGEELEALRRASIPHEVVPGISAALGAAAAAGISLTDRRVASQVLFSTFSRSPERGDLEWSQLTADTTLVLYMPGSDYAEVAERLQNSGLPADLPCVIVSRATHAQQQVRWSTVGSLAEEEKLPAPALFIVGRVASHEISEISESFWTPRDLETTRQAESIA
ncbi:MAG: uroporphyrin-III C-methyltransferase / precorrin-2 dehydrogenase / sirohydrochlorin ferrochelatase [Acidobacteriaceae bacterium]|jgi:uroporphyrin-III C-methyltransferase/precorrin-2 dehydrogenase/sirohydrochlorin ferrochelatase|nr:uroporphyrin-III C-methyltransferase / precorrin-2 dehydrogenase / sirohydrochlorin ferrochelatase [Acidobacteriaceae bacterium]